MKTLFVHIGQMKTGTSTLQHFLQDNCAVLNQQGFDYPTFTHRYTNVGPSRNGHFLLDIALPEGDGECAEKRAAAATCWACLEEAFACYDNVVVSEEHLWHDPRVDGLAVFEELLRRCAERGWALRLIVYLRRQDLFIASMRGQQVKEGYPHQQRPNAQLWEEWVQAPEGIVLDYHAHLERIAAIVGRESICVRVYDRAQLEKDGGNLYADFLGCLGQQLTEAYQLPATASNVSFSPNIQEIHRAVITAPDFRQPYRTTFREAATLCARNEDAQQAVTMFAPEEALAFLHQFEESNSRVARDYLHREGPLFDSTVTQTEKWTPANPGMAGDIVRYFNAAFAVQQRKLQHTTPALAQQTAAATQLPAPSEQLQGLAQAHGLGAGLPCSTQEELAATVRACCAPLFAREELLAADAPAAQADELARRYLPLGSNLLAAQQTCREQRETIAQLQAQAKQQRATIDELEGTVGELRGTVGELESAVEELEGTAAELRQKLRNTLDARVRRVCRAIAHPSRIIAHIKRRRGTRA